MGESLPPSGPLDASLDLQLLLDKGQGLIGHVYRLIWHESTESMMARFAQVSYVVVNPPRGHHRLS